MELEDGKQNWAQSNEREKSSIDEVHAPPLGEPFDDSTRTGTSVLSDNPFFIPNLTYTSEEEARVVRIIDIRLFPWILLTTFVLNMDRTNLSNAISDNLPADLGFTTDTVNLATAIYSVLFSLACLSGAVVCKIVSCRYCSQSTRVTYSPHEQFHPARCQCSLLQ